jgi:hypothetical protein
MYLAKLYAEVKLKNAVNYELIVGVENDEEDEDSIDDSPKEGFQSFHRYVITMNTNIMSTQR